MSSSQCSPLAQSCWHELYTKLLGLPNFLLLRIEGFEALSGGQGGKRCLLDGGVEPLLGEEDVGLAQANQSVHKFCEEKK